MTQLAPALDAADWAPLARPPAHKLALALQGRALASMTGIAPRMVALREVAPRRAVPERAALVMDQGAEVQTATTEASRREPQRAPSLLLLVELSVSTLVRAIGVAINIVHSVYGVAVDSIGTCLQVSPPSSSSDHPHQIYALQRLAIQQKREKALLYGSRSSVLG